MFKPSHNNSGLIQGNAVKNSKAVKIIYLSLILLGAALINGCGKQILDFRNADMVNGKVYAKGANTPFSGTLTNMPTGTAINTTPGIKKFIAFAMRFSDDARYPIAWSLTSGACDVPISDGYLKGEMICKVPRSNAMMLQVSMDNGAVTGDFKIYDLTPQNNVVSEAKFNDGVLEGVQKSYSLVTQKLVHTLTWKNNGAFGPEETFDPNTGNLTYRGGAVNGMTDGEVVRYAPDGKTLTYKGIYEKGFVAGVEESFSADTGKITGHAEMSGGKRNGALKQWDANGQLTVDQVYSNNVLVTDLLQSNSQAPSVKNTGTCVDNWMTAFRKENGEDSMISMDQMSEWENWCKQGKSPTKL
jgi:antitoxin component YwqK of YwqJK toxin-antitoxin module